jgi:hypothetical protein
VDEVAIRASMYFYNATIIKNVSSYTWRVILALGGFQPRPVNGKGAKRH